MWSRKLVAPDNPGERGGVALTYEESQEWLTRYNSANLTGVIWITICYGNSKHNILIKPFNWPLKHSFIDTDFYQLTPPVCNYTRNYIDIILRVENPNCGKLGTYNNIYCLHDFRFQVFDEQKNKCIFQYKSMKSVKIKIYRWMKGVCHQLLPIDSYNRYQSNQIYRFLSIDKSIPIFNDWLLQVFARS